MRRSLSKERRAVLTPQVNQIIARLDVEVYSEFARSPVTTKERCQIEV